MRSLVSLSLILLVIGAAEAKTNLNPEYGSPQYRANSVFSPDEPDPDKFKPDVLVVFHGFMSAVPNGTYKRVRKKLLPSVTVIGVNYDPLDVPGTVRFLDTVRKDYLQGRRVTVLGTSLGGFWAWYFGNRIGAQKIVLLNPIVDPGRHLLKLAGKTRENRRRIQSFHVTRADIEKYNAIRIRRDRNSRTLLVLSADDTNLDPNISRTAIGNASNVELAWYRTGGHTINLKKHPALARIAKFVRGR